MTDIVERLRDYARNCGGPPEEYLTWQAADEIGRLRAALQDMIEISTRNSEATLMLIAIRKCAEHALEPKP